MVRYVRTDTVQKNNKCPVCGDKLFFGCLNARRVERLLMPGWPIYLFVFARPQVWWLLQNGGVRRDRGVYGQSASIRGHSAPFESTSCIISEIEWRLNQCRKDGRILKHDAKYIERYYQDLALT